MKTKKQIEFMLKEQERIIENSDIKKINVNCKEWDYGYNVGFMSALQDILETE